MSTIGRKQWAIAEGYIPPYGHGPAPQLASHEAVCIFNAGDVDAHVAIMVYYENREPAGPFRFDIRARRTRHLRFNNFENPETIPVDTAFSSVITSDVPVVVQHTRLDTRQDANALLSTVAFPGND